MLYKIYMVCLLVGVAYSLFSLVLNGILHGLSLDFHFHFDTFSIPINPFVMMVFATVFGGVGLIFMRLIPEKLSLIPAVLCGAVTSQGLYRLFFVKLKSYEKETSKEKDALFKEAEVVERILPNGFGKISFVLDGNILSGAAKEYGTHSGINKGTKVFIIEIKENVYYVSKEINMIQTYQ